MATYIKSETSFARVTYGSPWLAGLLFRVHLRGLRFNEAPCLSLIDARSTFTEKSNVHTYTVPRCLRVRLSRNPDAIHLFLSNFSAAVIRRTAYHYRKNYNRGGTRNFLLFGDTSLLVEFSDRRWYGLRLQLRGRGPWNGFTRERI